jgi:hypothetical protein
MPPNYCTISSSVTRNGQKKSPCFKSLELKRKFIGHLGQQEFVNLRSKWYDPNEQQGRNSIQYILSCHRWFKYSPHISCESQNFIPYLSRTQIYIFKKKSTFLQLQCIRHAGVTDGSCAFVIQLELWSILGSVN